MRGFPGSGKSYTAAKLAPKDQIFTTDNFWGPEYNFDIEKIPIAHQWNIKQVENAMKNNITPIVVDNTNITWDEIKPYVQLAKNFLYDVKYKESESTWWQAISKLYNDPNFKPGTPAFDVAAEFLSKKTQHDVPLDTIKKMMSMWVPTK